MMSEPKTVIIGAGTLGLTLGRLLPGSVIFEKSRFVGGPSRTIQYKDFHFDTGLHTLPRLDPEVEIFLKPFLGDRLSKIPSSKVRPVLLKDGRLWHGLAAPHDVGFRSTPALALALRASYYLRRAFPRNGGSLEDYKINLSGDLFYRLFNKQWMEKYLGVPPHQLFHQRYQLPPPEWLPTRLIRWVLRGGRRKGRAAREVSYPLPWFGLLIEKLAEGLEVRCSSELTRIDFSGNRAVGIEINHQETIPCKQLIFTIAPQRVIHLLNPPPHIRQRARAVRYRDLIYVVLFFNTSHIMDEMVAVAVGQEIFTRAFEPKNWGEQMAPPDKTSVCFEIYCFRNDPIWRMADAEIIRRASHDFRRYYRAPEPCDGIVFRVPYALPILDAQLEESLFALQDFVSSFENIHFQDPRVILQGNNTNFAIKEAFRLAREVGRLAVELPTAH